MREELLEVRLVAYRGLWDKFAAPGTIGAFLRARRRRIPFLVDLESAQATLAELLNEELLKQRDVLVFLMTNDGDDVRRQLSEAALVDEGNICVIERTAAATVLPIQTIGFTKCGFYVPLDAAQNVKPRDVPVRTGDLLLYESVDTIQSVEAMRSSRLKSDVPTETRLRFAEREGAVMMKVADLVELELLVDCMRWIV